MLVHQLQQRKSSTIRFNLIVSENTQGWQKTLVNPADKNNKIRRGIHSMTFKDFFSNELKNERPIGVIMRFNIKRTEYPDSLYVFVEGPSDKKFYSSTKITKLQTDLYFYSVRDDFEDEQRTIVGKEAVLTCYSSLKKRKDIGASFKRCKDT